jgi:transcriptional regulator with XRE-family HTH domain
MPKSLRTPRQELLQSLLADARKAKGMTQTDVAKVLGKPQSFVAKYENGERRIDVIEFVDIAAALGAGRVDRPFHQANGSPVTQKIAFGP